MVAITAAIVGGIIAAGVAGSVVAAPVLAGVQMQQQKKQAKEAEEKQQEAEQQAQAQAQQQQLEQEKIQREQDAILAAGEERQANEDKRAKSVEDRTAVRARQRRLSSSSLGKRSSLLTGNLGGGATESASSAKTLLGG